MFERQVMIWKLHARAYMSAPEMGLSLLESLSEFELGKYLEGKGIHIFNAEDGVAKILTMLRPDYSGDLLQRPWRVLEEYDDWCRAEGGKSLMLFFAEKLWPIEWVGPTSSS